MSEPAANPPPAADDLAAFLAGLFRAWQAARLYGPGHPVLDEAAAQAAAAVTAVRGTPSIVVLPEGFECAGQALASDTATQALKALSAELHGLDISAIDLTPGLTAADASACAEALAEASEQPLVERVNAAGGGRLSLRAVSYRGVHVREAGHDAEPEADDDAPRSRARLWSRLNTGILDPASEATDPRLLAQQIGAEVAAQPRAALNGLRDSLVGAARELADRPDDEQRRGIDRMQALLAGLGPQLRASLESVPAAQPTPTSARPTDEAMATQITGAMSRGASAGAALSSEALMLCQKLAALGPGAVVEDEQDEPDDDDNPAEALADALESLFSRYDPTEFTPEDYRAQIRSTLDAAGPLGPRAGLDIAFAAETLGVRCAHIAHDLLAGDAAAPSAALQEVIAASVVPLIDAREFAVLFDRLQCGDTALTRALTRDVVIDRVLETDAQDQDGENLSIITELLSHAGDRAIVRLTHRLIHGRATDVGRAAHTLLGAAATATRHGALHRVLAQAQGPLPAAAAVLLAGLPFATATEALKAQLNAPEKDNRRAAYALLAAAFARWPAGFLSQALRERDAEVQACVLDRLSAGRDARHLALAKVALEGQSPAGVLPPAAFDRLTAGTLARGIEGQWVAAQVLRILASALSPRRAARGVRLAAALADHSENPAVRRALLWWRLMPARWLARLSGAPAAVRVVSDAPAALTPPTETRSAA